LGMKTNILANATDLSDHDLLARLEVLAGKEREASVELVAHLAALDSRRRSTLLEATAHSSPIAPLPFGSRRTPHAIASRLPEPAGASP